MASGTPGTLTGATWPTCRRSSNAQAGRGPGEGGAGVVGDVLAYHLKNADAAEMATTLQSIFNQADANAPRIAPDTATNSILVGGGTAANLARVRELVQADGHDPVGGTQCPRRRNWPTPMPGSWPTL